jgi:hypothetical protein
VGNVGDEAMSVWRVELKVFAETAETPPFTFIITPPPDHPAVVELLKWHRERQDRFVMIEPNEIGGVM